MFTSYPLKQTSPLQLNQFFEQFIVQTYGGQQAYNPVKETFDKMTSLRNSLEFQKFSQSYASDPKQCELLEKSILNYLQYCNVVEQRFRVDNNKPGAVSIPYTWAVSFPSFQQSACYSMKFEQACLYYNFSVVMLAFAQQHMVKQTPEDYKFAIQKLRWGLWAVSELRNTLAYLPQEVQNLHFDMHSRNLDVIENTMFGLVYVALFSNLVSQENQIGVDLVASLAGEAGKYFTTALGAVNQILAEPKSPFPKELFNRLKALVFYNVVNSLCQAALKMARFHQNLIEDQATKGHMGWALGYLRKGSNMLKQAQGNKLMIDLMTVQQKEGIANLVQQYNVQLPQAEQKNLQIYNHKVPSEGELPGTVIANDKYKVGILKPNLLTQTLPDEKNFSHFLSEEMIHFIQQAILFGEQRKQDAEKALLSLMEIKNKSYLDSQVGYFLDIGNQVGQAVIPPQIQQKIEAFKLKGGADQLKQQIILLKESSVNAGMLLQACKDKLNAEQQEDSNMKNQYQGKWNRTASATLNAEYFKNIYDYEGKFKQAQSVDVEILTKYESSAQYIELTYLSPQELQNQLPQGGDDGFAKQCQQDITKLHQKDAQVNQQILGIQQLIQQIVQTMANINFPQEIQNLQKQGMQQDQITQKLYSNVAQMIEQLNQQIQETVNIIQEIQKICLALMSKKKQSGQGGGKPIDQFKTGFNQCVEVYEEVTQGLTFYNTLYSLLIELDKKINDYLTARNMEKENLMQQLGIKNNNMQNMFMMKSPEQMQQQVNAYNQNFPQQQQQPMYQQQPYQQQPYQQQPYQQPYQPAPSNIQQPPQQQFYQGGQFPVGQSVFIPQGQQQQPQQNQNPFGGNFVQSNVYNPNQNFGNKK